MRHLIGEKVFVDVTRQEKKSFCRAVERHRKASLITPITLISKAASLLLITCLIFSRRRNSSRSRATKTIPRLELGGKRDASTSRILRSSHPSFCLFFAASLGSFSLFFALHFLTPMHFCFRSTTSNKRDGEGESESDGRRKSD